ncbi:hypothetical protein YC2023_019958 [Brassica napus]
MGYRYSTKNKPCTYDETKTCKPALATAADESHIFYMWSEDESHIFQIWSRWFLNLYCVFFLEFQMVKRYELMVQQARGVIKTYEGTLRFLDESDKELVQLEEGYNKMIEYLRALN